MHTYVHVWVPVWAKNKTLHLEKTWGVTENTIATFGTAYNVLHRQHRLTIKPIPLRTWNVAITWAAWWCFFRQDPLVWFISNALPSVIIYDCSLIHSKVTKLCQSLQAASAVIVVVVVAAFIAVVAASIHQLIISFRRAPFSITLLVDKPSSFEATWSYDCATIVSVEVVVVERWLKASAESVMTVYRTAIYRLSFICLLSWIPILLSRSYWVGRQCFALSVGSVYVFFSMHSFPSVVRRLRPRPSGDR